MLEMGTPRKRTMTTLLPHLRRAAFVAFIVILLTIYLSSR